MKEIQVKDIYIGKPDAKDEALLSNSEFLESYVIPPNYDYREIIENDKIIILGNKGTGKTALLFYLESECQKRDIASCTSFILFKSDYGSIQRIGLDKISRNIIKTINIENNELKNEQDFEYIWRWILFKHLIEENEKYNNGLFENDENWMSFVSLISGILPEGNNMKGFKMPSKVNIGCTYTNEMNGNQSFKPEVILDFESDNNFKEYQTFVSTIDNATEFFCHANKTDIPFFIFIDELEAFYSNDEILKRDLRMIRDLIISVKWLNDLLLLSNKKSIKVICSVRTEIVNSIMSFVVPKEINKIISGFSWPLIWNYSNTNSYAHPIFQIWLRRIQVSADKSGVSYNNLKSIYDNWFCPEVDNMPTVNYIINNTWNKPRDIVRFLNSTKNTIYSKRNVYTPAIFNNAISEYSLESLKELKEELNALYAPNEIEIIIMCLSGFKPSFSYGEFCERIEKYYKDSFLHNKKNEILNNLYRIGIIGNLSISSSLSRWEYTGFPGVILDDEWKIVVHRALWKSLSLSEKYGKVANIIEKNKSIDLYGKVFECTVSKIVLGFVIVTFEYNEETYHGSIHISELSNKYIRNIFSYINVGEKINAKVINYNVKHLKWVLTCKL